MGRKYRCKTRACILHVSPMIRHETRLYARENRGPESGHAASALTGSSMMATKARKASPTWSDVKGKLAEFDRAALLGLVQDLYAASKDNQTFLHSRFGLGGDLLAPYKTIIDRWIWPKFNQDTSVATAKKAIADFKKASGNPVGLAELMVFYCERAAGFSKEYGLDDEEYYDALVRMFDQALKVSVTLETELRGIMLDRLDAVRRISHNFGYGVGDDMDDLLAKYGQS